MSRHNEHEGHTDHEEISIETLSTPPTEIIPAPLLSRFIAGVVDSCIIALLWVVFLIAGQGFTAFWAMTGATSMTPVAMAYLVTITFAYYFVLEGIFATTIGKSLLKLCVLGKDGEPCSLGASFKRNLLRFLDWLPLLYVVAVIVILTSRDRQRIGDRLAATIVTKAPEKDINPPPAPFLFH